MLFWVWVGACWPFVCVMVVGVGVCGFWWRVFQWCVAVVSASRRVPGVVVCVLWLVSGLCSGVPGVVLGFGVWACSGVVGLVCVSWFRMLTCLASFRVFGFVCLVNNGWGAWWLGLVLVWWCFCLCLFVCA